MVRVLIVDDLAVVRELLAYILTSDPEIEVAGGASNGSDALAAVERFRPDVITMDINMPGMNGFDATRRIMETIPTPIVIVSGSWDTKEVATNFHALEAGALAVTARPPGPGHPQHEALARELVQTVKLMSEVRVIKRWPRTRYPASSTPILAKAPASSRRAIKLVAAGASTGGPMALQTLLSLLPKEFPVPVLIVQHMAPGFVQGFVEWLEQTCHRPVHTAVHNAEALPGCVYVAADGCHMGVSDDGRIKLAPGQASNGLCPSVSWLFRSVAESWGPKAAGVLLTGMGKDGAEELRLMRERGAVTFAQDKESALIHGMPGEAIRLGGAMHVLPPERIAAELSMLAG